MMFSDEEIKEIPETSFMKPGDEIISITEVCLSDKYYKKDLGFNVEPSQLPSSSRNDLDSRSSLRDGFFPESLELQQARFAWTEEDGNIVALVSEPGFGTTGQTTYGKDLDAALDSEIKEADSSSVFKPSGRLQTLAKKSMDKQHQVTSTSGNSITGGYSKSQGACKIDKSDPRSRFHYVKYVKRHGRTVKLWECGICSREFQHQYTLMRHLPTHTDERNFHCSTCGKSFRQLSTLSQHRAIHSAERPYACEMCNKTFNRVSTLISHRKTHNFEKPYKCHLCPKGFHQKGNLRNHLFTHTNERPYRCNICYKGFNQQSNLVCHKNKAHSDVACPATITRNRSTPVIRSPEVQPDTTKPQTEHCEVSSTVGPFLPSVEGPSSSKWTPRPEAWKEPNQYEPAHIWNEKHAEWSTNSGVIVDPINTYHMGVALATKQTPFALLKPDNGTAVLVKVIDTNLPGGKQMLVPATAEDFRVGGKIVIKDEPGLSTSTPEMEEACGVGVGGAVQIRVPVVATVVPRVAAGGRLHLAVQEPHHQHHHHHHHHHHHQPHHAHGEVSANRGNSLQLTPNALRRVEPPHHGYEDELHTGPRTSSSSILSPSPPSPPLDFISMDLFEPMECIPLGPQITAVDIDQPPPSDDSDIFIGEFEENNPLSDSD